MKGTMGMTCWARVGVTTGIFVLVVMTCTLGQAQTPKPIGIIPPERMGDWRPGITVGVPGGIPTDRTHLIDVTKAPYNADNTGAADAQPAIMQAIANAKDKDVVYLPAGTYRVNSAITIAKSRITIRGAGPDKTTIMAYNGGRGGAIDIFFLTSNNAGWWSGRQRSINITGRARKGATVLNLGNTGALNAYPNGGVGQLCQISLRNDPRLPVIAPAHYEYLRKQVSRIVAKTSSTVTISPGLLFDLPAELAPRLTPAGGNVEFVGVEDLTVNGANSSTRHSPIVMNLSYGCWLKNVSVLNVPNWHMLFFDSLQCEVRHCFLARRNAAMGPDGGGLTFGGCSFFLVEDNTLTEAFPGIEVNNTSGSVFAYNFCDDRGIQGGLLGGSINTNHGAHNSFNLYEGNYAPKIQCDGYHGSASQDTIFRNWFHGTSSKTTQFWVCVNLNRFTRFYSVVGNVLGRQGYNWLYESPDNGFGYGDHLIYALGFPGMGNGGFSGVVQPSRGRYWADWERMLASQPGKGPGPNGFRELDLDVRATTLRKGNYNYKDKGVPAGESLGQAVLPKSLYLKEKPAWFGDLNWPPFGPDTTFEQNKIPAQVRYEQGRQ